MCQKGVAKHVEQPRLALAARTAKGCQRPGRSRHRRNRLPELDIGQTHRGSSGTRPAEHFLGHVDANDATVRPDLTGRDKAVETAPRAEIDHPLARLQGAKRERVTDTGKSLNGAVGKAATTAWS